MPGAERRALAEAGDGNIPCGDRSFHAVPESGAMSIPADQKQREFESEALVHLDALYGLALRLSGGDEPRAEDLVQEAVLKAYRAWDRFEAGTNCRAWLMTILRNTFINRYRAAKVRPSEVDFSKVEQSYERAIDDQFLRDHRPVSLGLAGR